MRRPLKPFVTEYKAGNRRPKDGTGAFGVEPETSQSEHGASKFKTTTRRKPPGAASGDASTAAPRQVKGQATRRGDAARDTTWANDTARFAAAQGEESYEAAMRAADALFSGATARQGSPETTGFEAEAPIAKTDAPAPTGGRILRAIDEPPGTTLADVEAERAPKRRGRKPGSKNKPKIPAVLDAYVAVAHAAVDSDDEDDESTAIYQAPPSPRWSVPIYPAIVMREERFRWIRTKLGPGERWKRRLPKVIW